MSKAPGELADDHARAHQRLADALLNIQHPHALPCRLDDRFISEKADERAEAADMCLDCPVFVPCGDAGRFEPFGIWAGVDRTVQRPKRRGGGDPR